MEVIFLSLLRPISGTYVSAACPAGKKFIDLADKEIKWKVYHCGQETDIKPTIKTNSLSRKPGRPYLCLDKEVFAETRNLKYNVSYGDDFTISVWLRAHTDIIAPRLDIIGSTHGSIYAIVLLYNQGVGDGYSYCPNGAAWVFATGITPPSNQWHHCALTSKNNMMMFFLNGRKLNTTKNEGLEITKNFTIGTSARGRTKDCLVLYDEIVYIKGQCMWDDDFDVNDATFTDSTGYGKEGIPLLKLY